MRFGNELKTNSKGTQNEPNSERQMHRFNAKSGFVETSPNCSIRFSARHPGRAGFLSSLGTTQPGKYKKSGNEAKEYLKTKDIAFLNAANYARVARKLAQVTR
jgi:hypothetical protein